MSGRPKAELVLSESEREQLKALTMRRKTAQALALRARIVLACAEGRSTGRSLLDDALSGGARALHSVLGRDAQGVRTGAIQAGASADIVSLNASHPVLAERFEAVSPTQRDESLRATINVHGTTTSILSVPTRYRPAAYSRSTAFACACELDHEVTQPARHR